MISHLEPMQLPSYKTYTLDDAWCQTLGITYAITLQEERMLVAKGTTGLRTWEASLRLAEYIIHHWTDVIGTRAVLELGSGTGLLGLTCALLASPRVTMTDFHPDVLALLATNVKLNESRTKTLPTVTTLDWENFTASALAHHRNSVVLGADLVYDPSIIPALINVLSTLCLMQCSVYIASTVRNANTFAQFTSALVNPTMLIYPIVIPLMAYAPVLDTDQAKLPVASLDISSTPLLFFHENPTSDIRLLHIDPFSSTE
ncbi:hypothetical protein H4R35_004315 [Dimargaris xerosporica]|nr:hypothetical protein H4R35_004315 [Dimargaris xerosporica]